MNTHMGAAEKKALPPKIPWSRLKTEEIHDDGDGEKCVLVWLEKSYGADRDFSFERSFHEVKFDSFTSGQSNGALPHRHRPRC